MATQDDFIRTALRVPPDLHKAIHEAAAADNRTFNAEIIGRLQGSFKAPSTEVQFSRGDDEATDGLFAMIRKLREEGQAKDATIEALRREIQLRIESTATQKQLVQTQSTLIFALESHVVELVRQLPDELVTDDIRQLAQTCNFDLEMERAVAKALATGGSEVEDARITSMTVPVTVRGKTTSVKITQEPVQSLGASITDPNKERTAVSRTKRAALVKAQASKKH